MLGHKGSAQVVEGLRVVLVLLVSLAIGNLSATIVALPELAVALLDVFACSIVVGLLGCRW